LPRVAGPSNAEALALGPFPVIAATPETRPLSPSQ